MEEMTQAETGHLSLRKMPRPGTSPVQRYTNWRELVRPCVYPTLYERPGGNFGHNASFVSVTIF
jgi:hypothetical protein